MKVLFDTNVVLDVWLRREPFWHDSASLMAMAETKKVTGILSPTSITTLHYLGKKVLGEDSVRNLISELMAIFMIGSLEKSVIEESLESQVIDFEDAILEGLAAFHGADCIATRNTKDFRKSRIPAMEPIGIIKQNQAVEDNSG